MGRVILIVGPHGVGKTSLLNYVKQQGEFCVFEGFKIPVGNYNLKELSDFCEYQKKYLEYASFLCCRVKNSKSDGIFLRTIEECSFYYHVNKKSNHMMDKYHEEVRKNNYVGADMIIYLDAHIDELKQRCISDNKRNMETTNKWYRDYYVKYDRYWKKYPRIIVIDTSKKSVQEIYIRIKELCDERSICVKK